MLSELSSGLVIAFDGTIPSVGNGVHLQRAGKNVAHGQSACVVHRAEIHSPFESGVRSTGKCAEMLWLSQCFEGEVI